MRITLAGSGCGLLDKSLLNSCKKIISISKGFIHRNELEVLTQCPQFGAYPMLRLNLSSFDVATIREHERRSRSTIIGSYKIAFFLQFVRNQLSRKHFWPMPLVWTCWPKKWIGASNENMFSCEKNIFAHNINKPMPQV